MENITDIVVFGLKLDLTKKNYIKYNVYNIYV